MADPEQIDSEEAYRVTDVEFIPLAMFCGLLAVLIYMCVHRRYEPLFVGMNAVLAVFFFAIAWKTRGARVWLRSDGLISQKFLGRKHFDSWDQIGILNKNREAFTLVLQHGRVVVNRPEAVRELEPVLRSRVRGRLK